MEEAGIVPMILAAGAARRLRPLSDTLAKAVVPFLNRPLLDHTFDWLRRCGFRRAVLNLHHLPASIESRYGERAFGMSLQYSREPSLLGTAGGPRAALRLLGERVLIVNGDVLTLAALGPLIEHHLESGALATIGLYRGAAARGFPRVHAEPSGRLLALRGGEPPQGGTVAGVFAGVHLVERRALELLPEGVPSGTTDLLYPRLLEAGLPVAAIPLAGSWFEVGDPARYIDGQLTALRHRAAPLSVERHLRFLDGGYVSPHAHLENTRLRPPFLVGSGARVKHGARVEGCVIGDRCRIEAGSWLRECVLWPGAWISPGARLQRCVVVGDARVPAGTVAVETVFTSQGSVRFAAASATGT